MLLKRVYPGGKTMTGEETICTKTEAKIIRNGMHFETSILYEKYTFEMSILSARMSL